MAAQGACSSLQGALIQKKVGSAPRWRRCDPESCLLKTGGTHRAGCVATPTRGTTGLGQVGPPMFSTVIQDRAARHEGGFRP